jgi:hypothetical protein
VNCGINPIIDLHVHIGQWHESYHDPITIGEQLLVEAPVDVIGVSSTTACREPYSIRTILLEVDALMKKFPGQIFHWLWVHPGHIPESLSVSGDVPVHGIKIHPYQHDWHSNPKLIVQVFSLANKCGIPILLHTGGRKESDAGYFDQVLSKFQGIDLIMAHARPVDQAIRLVKTHPHLWLDTAFVSIESLKMAEEAGVLDRFVFGSDYPINGPERGVQYQDILGMIPVGMMAIIQESSRNFLLRYF